MIFYFVLGEDARTPVPADLMTWARRYESGILGAGHDGEESARPGAGWARVARTELPDGVSVSTVFLGLDHRFGNNGPPLVFETMVFCGALDGEQVRYSTWAEAEAGHEAMVARVRAGAAVQP
jgi:hypothetical protein